MWRVANSGSRTNRDCLPAADERDGTPAVVADVGGSRPVRDFPAGKSKSYIFFLTLRSHDHGSDTNVKVDDGEGL